MAALPVGIVVAGKWILGLYGVGVVAGIAGAIIREKKAEEARVYTRYELLGEGGFGAVYVYKTNNKKFAGKEVALAGLAPMRGNTKKEISQVKALWNEIQKLQTLKHKNIVQFVDFTQDEAKLYMFMELMELSLSKLLKKRTIPENEAKLYTRGILDGLIYLHDNSVIHCDIKGPNVLLEVGKVAKLGDFGLAKYYEENQSAMSTKYLAGTIHYMAPDLIDGNKHGERADVWAVGCTIYEMLCGKPPFSELKFMKVSKMTENLAQRSVTENSTVLSRLQKNFLLQIFVKKEERPAARSLRNDIWLR